MRTTMREIGRMIPPKHQLRYPHSTISHQRANNTWNASNISARRCNARRTTGNGQQPRRNVGIDHPSEPPHGVQSGLFPNFPILAWEMAFELSRSHPLAFVRLVCGLQARTDDPQGPGSPPLARRRGLKRQRCFESDLDTRMVMPSRAPDGWQIGDPLTTDWLPLLAISTPDPSWSDERR